MFTVNDLFEMKKMLEADSVKQNKTLFETVNSLFTFAKSEAFTHIYKYAGFYIRDIDFNLREMDYLNYKIYLRRLYCVAEEKDKYVMGTGEAINLAFMKITLNDEAENLIRLHRDPKNPTLHEMEKMLKAFDKAFKPLFSNGDLHVAKRKFKIQDETNDLILDIKLERNFDHFYGFYFSDRFVKYFKNNMMQFRDDEIIIPIDACGGWLRKVTIKASNKLKNKIYSYETINDEYIELIKSLGVNIRDFIYLHN